MTKKRVSFLAICLNPGFIFFLSIVFVAMLIVERNEENTIPDLDIRNIHSTHSLKKKGEYPPIKINFKDVTLESGIDFYHTQGGRMLNAISEVVGSGACTADFDNDGFSDIYAVNGTGYTHFYGKKWWWYKTPHNTLYHNNGDGTFTDVTEKAGVGDSGWGMGCAFADYDNDGDPDLYVTNYGSNILYRNNGDGTFLNVTEKAGVGDEGWGTSIAWGDYDNDGDPDIYVANYLVFHKTMNPAEPNSAFKMNRPLLMRSKLFDGQRNVLYQNNGDGSFTDVTDRAGVGNAPGRSLGVVFFDYNNDGYPDIYITNDSSRNVLYKNSGGGFFTDVGGESGIDSPLSGMGVAVGDYDNDGDMDIFSTYSQKETNILYENMFFHNGNKLYYSYKNGFADVTVDSGLGEEVSVGYFGWGTEFADFDNDGFLDLFVSNGHGMPDFDNPQTTIGQKNQIFRNMHDGTFMDAPDKTGHGLQGMNPSRGTVFGDFDNDGDIDIFIVNNNDYANLLRNETVNNNHWLTIKLKGTKSNRDGMGARVRVLAEDLQQIREVGSGSGYLSQSDIRLHFGLGKYARVDLIEIRWPGGGIQKFTNIETNRFVTIIEGENKFHTRKFETDKNRKVKDFKKRKKNKVLRIEAIKVLGQYKNKQSLEVLIRLLKDEDQAIRKEAVATLGNIGNNKAVDHLLILLKSEEDHRVREEIIRSLKNFESDKIISPLMHALQSDKATMRRESVISLSFLLEREQTISRSTMLKKRLAVAPLIKILKDPDALVREYAVKGLGYSESYRAVIPVMDMFQDKSLKVRVHAVRASGMLRDKRAVAPLMNVLRNSLENNLVRVQASLALNRLENNSGLRYLIEIAKEEKDNDVRYKTVSVMTSLIEDEESVLLKKRGLANFLYEERDDPDYRIRREIVRITGRIKSGNYMDIVREGLDDPEIEVRREAAITANSLGNEELLLTLKDFLYEEDKIVKREAIIALGKLTPMNNNDMELLKEIANDKEEKKDIRLAALSSLIKEDSTTVVNIIKDLLKDKKSALRVEYMKILRLTRDREAITPLLACLERDKKNRVKEEAVLSLEKFFNEDQVYPVLLKKLKNKRLDKEVRSKILSLFVKFKPANILPSLIRIINDKEDDMRFEVVENIVFFDANISKNILLNIIMNKKNGDTLRIKALSTISGLNDPKIIAEILKLV